MSTYVAVWLDDARIFKSLQRLDLEVGITGKDLVTVMSSYFEETRGASAFAPGASTGIGGRLHR